jgi:hypothetical protein
MLTKISVWLLDWFGLEEDPYQDEDQMNYWP